MSFLYSSIGVLGSSTPDSTSCHRCEGVSKGRDVKAVEQGKLETEGAEK